MTHPNRDKPKNTAAHFRQLHRAATPLVLPNAWDAVSARLFENAGAAAIVEAKRKLGLPGGVLICAPVPAEYELPAAEANSAIEQALAEAEAQGVRGKAITPFLLARIVELTGERSLRANLALLENNVRIGAQIAAALAS